LESGKGTSGREGSEKDATPDLVFVERGSDAPENFSAEDLDPCGEAGEIFHATGSRPAAVEPTEERRKKGTHLSGDCGGNGLPRRCNRADHGRPPISFRRSRRHGFAAADNRRPRAGGIAAAARNEEIEFCKASHCTD
jgi:hypothetical protein